MLKNERLVAITLLLQSRGKMTAERLAAITGVSVRTIYRDMDALSLAHIPVTMDYGPGGGYYLPDSYRVAPANFTGDEALALALGGAMAGGYHLMEEDDGLRGALLKLEAALPEEYRADFRAASERILVDTAPWHERISPGSPHLETVRHALLAREQIDILYRRAGGSSAERRRVDPHGLVSKAGVWYLVAFCHLRQDFRIFRLSRIDAIDVSGEQIVPVPGFELAKFWEEARTRFEEVSAHFTLTLRVSPSALQAMPNAEVLDEGNGAILVRVETGSAADAVSYVLSLGTQAEVLHPPEVRDEVARESFAMATQYADPARRQVEPPPGPVD